MYSRPDTGAMDRDALPKSSEKRDEFLRAQPDVAKDLAHEARADGFAGMHRYDGGSAVGMLQKVMAAFDADILEPGLRQGTNDIGAGGPRKPGHAAIVIR